MSFWTTDENTESYYKETTYNESELERKARTLIITTMDIRRDYEIIGVTSADDPWELRMDAAKKGADAIIGYRINSYAVGMHAMGPCELNYGTLVKFK